MPRTEVKAAFKAINIKDRTVLQFELSPMFLPELPELTRLANTNVMLTIESEQPELPLDDEPEDGWDQPEIPVDDPEPVARTKREARAEARELGIKPPPGSTVEQIDEMIAQARASEGGEG